MSYGYCPICGSAVLHRERRINGNDTCARNHTFPSKDSLPQSPETIACVSKGESVLAITDTDVVSGTVLEVRNGWVSVRPRYSQSRISMRSSSIFVLNGDVMGEMGMLLRPGNIPSGGTRNWELIMLVVRSLYRLRERGLSPHERSLLRTTMGAFLEMAAEERSGSDEDAECRTPEPHSGTETG
jgi:hypothetical protein